MNGLLPTVVVFQMNPPAPHTASARSTEILLLGEEEAALCVLHQSTGRIT